MRLAVTTSIWAAFSHLLFRLAAAQDGPVVPSNATTQNFSNASQPVLLRLSDVINLGAQPPAIHSLTPQSYTDLPSDSSATTGTGQTLVIFSPQIANNLTLSPTSLPFSQSIAYISCDPEDYQGQLQVANITQIALSKNVAAVLFYSQTSTACNLDQPDGRSPSSLDVLSGISGSNFTSYYSLADSGVSRSLLDMLGGPQKNPQMPPTATVMTQVAFNNAISQSPNNSGLGSSSPQTAVAMIILYSITGVITALFLIIIVTGAIRAHRHPERYGPRNVLGRPRQNRAKGIARAMLDSIPIVKFGEGTARDMPKPGDVEMTGQTHGNPNSNPRTTCQEQSHPERASNSRPNSSSSNTHPRSVEATTANQISTDGAADPHNQASSSEPTSDHPTDEDNNNNLGCSICTEDFEKGQDIRVLPCDHKFHPACVDPWLLDVSGTCPLCRVDLRPRSSSGTDRDDNGEGRANGEGGDLPPPLDPSSEHNPGSAGHRRRDALLRRVRGAGSREQRLAALRGFREEQVNESRAAGGGQEGEGSAAAARRRTVEGSRLERVRRTIFAGRRGEHREAGNGESAHAHGNASANGTDSGTGNRNGSNEQA